ncbi:MAG: hypothetical protein NVS2B7_13780 [Herpetosiphon sp.]
MLDAGEKELRTPHASRCAHVAFQGRRWMGSVVLTYLVICLFLFAPVLSDLGSSILVGSDIGRIDAWQNVWNIWWVKRALLHGQNPFFTSFLFYPYGASLFWHTLNLPTTLVGVPLAALWNPTVGFTLVSLLTFVASGSAMCAMAYRLTGSRVGAWLAGGLYTFSPYHIAKLADGHLNLISLQWLPLFVLSLHAAFQERRKGVAWAAVLLVLILLTDLYYGMFSIIFLGLYSALEAARRRSWRGLGLCMATSTLIVLPVLVVVASLLLGHDTVVGFVDWKDRQVLFSATPLDLIMPNPRSALWGEALRPLAEQWRLAAGGTSLGLMVLVLAGVAVWGNRREVWPWLVLAAAVFIFEMGPLLVLNGHATGIPLPYALVNLVPAAHMGRRPNHLIVYRSVLLSLLAAFGWAWLAAHWSRRTQWTVAAVIIGAISIDLWPRSLETAQLNVAPVYRELAAAAPGAILELPPLPKKSLYLQAQLVHQHPIVGGYLSRNPPYPLVETAEGLRQLWNADPGRQSIVARDWRVALVPTLRAYGIGYVVLHLQLDSNPSFAMLQPDLQHLLEPIYRDSLLAVYRVPSAVQPAPVVELRGDGWYPLEQQRGLSWQWIGASSNITVMNPAATNQQVTLGAGVAAFEHQKEMAVYLQRGSRWTLLTRWHVELQQRDYKVLVPLAPGENNLRFATEAGMSKESTTRPLGAVFTSLHVEAVDAAH